MKRRLLIIPARSGSKKLRIKILVISKNPLYFPCAKKSKLFNKIHVSTDSEKTKS